MVFDLAKSGGPRVNYQAVGSELGAIALSRINLDKNLAGKNPNLTAKGAYPIATLTWILAYEKGNGRNTKAIQDTLYKLLTDEYQDKAAPLGFVPLNGDILEKSISAVKKNRWINFSIHFKLS